MTAPKTHYKVMAGSEVGIIVLSCLGFILLLTSLSTSRWRTMSQKDLTINQGLWKVCFIQSSDDKSWCLSLRDSNYAHMWNSGE